MEHPENNTTFLAAELVKDDNKIKVTWPDDPLVAQLLFLELEYRFKSRQLEDAFRLRTQAAEMQERMKVSEAAARLDRKLTR